MPLQATSGAASYDAFGGGAAAVPTYIEDVFSTYLYTGNGSTQTITNGIDLSGKGGLVWAKDRDAANSNTLYDTARGVRKTLYSNTTGAQVTEATNEGVYAFGTTGFSIGGGSNTSNGSGNKIASWTFREQPKFFDVVTYTGDGATTARAIAHSLGSVPGCIIVFPINDTGDRKVYHRSLGSGKALVLQTTAASANVPSWGNTDPTSTNFYVAYNEVNKNGINYVAYIFAHDAGGFGLTGTDNVISCGSFTTDASANASVTLGYEPQFVLYKRSSGASNWFMLDNMRGWNQTGFNDLKANLSDAENAVSGNFAFPTSTGFAFTNSGALSASSTYIYIAIRRGPMKVPTSGTSVFNSVTLTGNSSQRTVSTTVKPDLFISKLRNVSGASVGWFDRLRGVSPSGSSLLMSDRTDSEVLPTDIVSRLNNDNVVLESDATYNISNTSPWLYVNWNFTRASGFFDEVCYTGTGSARTINHNLGVVPELIIEKCRNTANTQGWQVYAASQGASNTAKLNSTAAFGADGNFGTAPTSTVFSINGADHPSGETYVAYLFATCAGVSKVGSYTGTGTTQTISCGFTGGARWVMIKRTDSTGDWGVWDTARGMVSGTNPRMRLNSTGSETTGNWVYTTTGGFQIVTTDATVNASGGTYIYLAIA